MMSAKIKIDVRCWKYMNIYENTWIWKYHNHTQAVVSPKVAQDSPNSTDAGTRALGSAEPALSGPIPPVQHQRSMALFLGWRTEVNASWAQIWGRHQDPTNAFPQLQWFPQHRQKVLRSACLQTDFASTFDLLPSIQSCQSQVFHYIPFKSVLCSSEATHGLIKGFNLARWMVQLIHQDEFSEIFRTPELRNFLLMLLMPPSGVNHCRIQAATLQKRWSDLWQFKASLPDLGPSSKTLP